MLDQYSEYLKSARDKEEEELSRNMQLRLHLEEATKQLGEIQVATSAHTQRMLQQENENLKR